MPSPHLLPTGAGLTYSGRELMCAPSYNALPQELWYSGELVLMKNWCYFPIREVICFQLDQHSDLTDGNSVNVV